MGDTIIKTAPDEDFYVVYSSVVDSPTYFGSRTELESEYRHCAPDRFARADATGSSCAWTTPPEFGWGDETLWVREGVKDATRPDEAFAGELKRSDLRAFCETLQEDGYFHPPAGMLRWIVGDE